MTFNIIQPIHKKKKKNSHFQCKPYLILATSFLMIWNQKNNIRTKYQ